MTAENAVGGSSQRGGTAKNKTSKGQNFGRFCPQEMCKPSNPLLYLRLQLDPKFSRALTPHKNITDNKNSF